MNDERELQRRTGNAGRVEYKARKIVEQKLKCKRFRSRSIDRFLDKNKRNNCYISIFR